MKNFPTIRELAENPTTKGELVEKLYPSSEGYNVDYAVPQSWLNMAYERGMDCIVGGNLAANFVTVYHNDGERQCVSIMPLTAEGILVLSLLAMTVR